MAGTLGAFAATAPAAMPVAALGAAAGLPLAWSGRGRLDGWALLAALGVLLAYGAPVILSGQATFAGYVRLDDTATWLNVIDHFGSGPHAAADGSTYSLVYDTTVGSRYPRGAFVLPAVARPLTGIDAAWVFQPYLASCAAALALCLYGLIAPIVASPRVRALVAFLAAQPALLYGYSLWGGIKELTAAFLVGLMAVLATTLLRERPAARARSVAVGSRRRCPDPDARGRRRRLGCARIRRLSRRLGSGWRRGSRAQATGRGCVGAQSRLAWLLGLTAAFVIPVWVILGDFLSHDAGLFSAGQDEQTRLGNLLHPLSPFQLAGIWPVGDFRTSPPSLPTVLLVGSALALAAWALWETVRRRQFGLALYAAAGLGTCGLFYLLGTTPWVVGKALTISSPALLLAALVGATMLWRRRRAGVLVLAALAFAVLWTGALAYHDELLAPRARLAELQRIGELLDGRGPTLLNEYEIYGDNHFLRGGEPTAPAEYRTANLALLDGTLLTKSAWADLDSFPLATIEAYPSIVTRRSPAESRPPSNYSLVWSGRLLRPLAAPTRLGRSGARARPARRFDDLAVLRRGPERAPTAPSARLTRSPFRLLRHPRDRRARADPRSGSLVAYQRPAPVVARGDQTLWPGPWLHDDAAHSLTANSAGDAGRPHPPGGPSAVRALARRQLQPRLRGHGRRPAVGTGREPAVANRRLCRGRRRHPRAGSPHDFPHLSRRRSDARQR